MTFVCSSGAEEERGRLQVEEEAEAAAAAAAAAAAEEEAARVAAEEDRTRLQAEEEAEAAAAEASAVEERQTAQAGKPHMSSEGKKEEGKLTIDARAQIGLDQYTGGGAACGAPRPFLRVKMLSGKNCELCINADG